MATAPPIKTTQADIDMLAEFLRSQVGWSELEVVKNLIPAKHADNRKIEAMRYLGLLERDGSNIKLSDDGRRYAKAGMADRPAILRERLRQTPLYHATLQWMHYGRLEIVTKTDIANYWHDKHADELDGASGDALTDAAVFFARMVGAADLGKFVAAGKGRDTHVQADKAALTSYVEQTEPPQEREPTPPPVKELPAPTPPPKVGVSTDLNVRVEIHIAADAKPATIEEIFKNMRKYLVDRPDSANGD